MSAWKRLPGQPGGAKYGNKKVELDGMEFDSKLEARRFSQLRLMEKAGMIHGLERQVEFELIPVQREPDRTGPRGGIIKGHVIEKKCSYFADFVYYDKEGQRVVEDAKGYRDGQAYAVFTIKRKLMLQKYGIRVQEV